MLKIDSNWNSCQDKRKKHDNLSLIQGGGDEVVFDALSFMELLVVLSNQTSNILYDYGKAEGLWLSSFEQDSSYLKLPESTITEIYCYGCNRC